MSKGILYTVLTMLVLWVFGCFLISIWTENMKWGLTGLVSLLLVIPFLTIFGDEL